VNTAAASIQRTSQISSLFRLYMQPRFPFEHSHPFCSYVPARIPIHMMKLKLKSF
jgi:hypothetical protein